MLYNQVWISILNLLTTPTAANLNARAASPSASSSSAQLILANEAAAISYNPNDLLPTQMSALYQMLQDTQTATPSSTTPAISYDEGSITAAPAAAAAATALSASFAAEQSTAIIIPPPINNPLTAAPPPEATSSPFLYFGTDVPINGYYVLPTANSAPYPIANATTGLGVSPGNVSGIVPFTGQGCGRWEMGFRWKGLLMMSCGAVVVLVRVFL